MKDCSCSRGGNASTCEHHNEAPKQKHMPGPWETWQNAENAADYRWFVSRIEYPQGIRTSVSMSGSPFATLEAAKAAIEKFWQTASDIEQELAARKEKR